MVTGEKITSLWPCPKNLVAKISGYGEEKAVDLFPPYNKQGEMFSFKANC